MNGVPAWTDEQSSKLRELWTTNATYEQMAERSGVPSADSIYNKAKRLGLPRRNVERPTNWKPDQVERLTAMWRDGKSSQEIAMTLVMTRASVLGKLNRLGLLGMRRVSIADARPGRADCKPPPAPAPGPEPFVPRAIPGEPVPLALPLTELKERTCRWAIRREELPVLRPQDIRRARLLRIPHPPVASRGCMMSSILPRIWAPRAERPRFALVPIDRVRPPPSDPPEEDPPWTGRREQRPRFEALMAIIEGGAARIDDAIRATEVLTQISVAQMRGPQRDVRAVKARQIAIWAALRMGRSLTHVGRAVERDHSTALHARLRVEAILHHFGRDPAGPGIADDMIWLWLADWPRHTPRLPSTTEIPGVFPWHVVDRG